MVARFRALAAVVLLGCLPAACGAQSILEQIEREVAAVVRQARGGVVAIEDERLVLGAKILAGDVAPAKASGDIRGLKRFSAEEQKPGPIGASASLPKSGTGFCLAGGYVATTADVLEGMVNPLVVTDSGTRYRARVVKIDPELNIGLLKLPENSRVPELPLGDSSAVLPGHFAIGLGNQGGRLNTVSLATVSEIRTEPTFSGTRFYPRLIQIAGTVGAGGSGSPLLNTRGQVIGMLAAAPASEPAETGAEKPGDPLSRAPRPAVTSAGFAIPINDLKPVFDEMRHAKFYARAWIGVDLREEGRTEQDAQTLRVVRTLRIEGVYPESPAAQAGLRKGDVVRSMNGVEIHTLGDFRSVLVSLRFGGDLAMEVIRDGSAIAIKIRYQMRPPNAKVAQSN